MNKNLSSGSVDINPLQERLISTIEKQRENGCRLDEVQKTAANLKEAYRRILAAGEDQLSGRFGRSVGAALPLLENAYTGWKAVTSCFEETLQLAFNGSIPRENLLLDDIHASLKTGVGDPISALYARARRMWNTHLDTCPWDAFIDSGDEHPDYEEFIKTLDALNHGDDLDVEDAIENLTGRFRYLFASAIEDNLMDSNSFVSALWKRPEIIVINDYWQGKTQARILDKLRCNASQKFAGSFAKVLDFFMDDSTEEAGSGAASSTDRILQLLKKSDGKEREKLLRCLMLHPSNEVRRYAAANVDLGGFWKVVTPEGLPCSTILSQLEQVVGSNRFNESLRKIFFNAVYRRLLTLTSRSDVLYARGITRIFMQLDFLMEDVYFEKLITLLNYLEAKEKFYGFKDSYLDDYTKRFREEKKKIGAFESKAPDFQAVPAVVLRKLARDGHFWFELSTHPIYKVAKETIPHISTTDRSYRVAMNHNVNQDVLRAVGKKRSLFTSLKAKLALLSNPRTPPPVSMDYIPELTRADIEALLRRRSIHPELRRVLTKRYNY